MGNIVNATTLDVPTEMDSFVRVTANANVENVFVRTISNHST